MEKALSRRKSGVRFFSSKVAEKVHSLVTRSEQGVHAGREGKEGDSMRRNCHGGNRASREEWPPSRRKETPPRFVGKEKV